MVDKKAQFLISSPNERDNSSIEFDDITVVDMVPANGPAAFNEDDVVLLEVDSVPENELSVSEDIVFLLPDIPGAPDAEGIPEDEVEEEQIEVEEGDDWNWQAKGGVGGFISWLQDRFQNIPKHTGYDTTGLEKAISYFEALDKEISKAMRTDYKNEIDHAQAERAREQIENGLERLIERLERVRAKKYKRHAKKKAKAWYQDSQEIVKEAGTTKINGISIVVPLFISRIARILINGHVSAGHDMADMFKKLDKEFGLNKREKAEVLELVENMGFPINEDRGILESGDKTEDGFDKGPNYNN